MEYLAYCDDFGPVNMASIANFITMLEQETRSYPDGKIVFCVDEGRRPLTNAVFLLGAYMIIRHNITSDKVAERFAWLDKGLIEPFRDATDCPSDFDLTLLDCWKGLQKGQDRGWVRYAPTGYLWGAIDIEEYSHYDNPFNGNLHQVVPGKFVAFAGPRDLGGQAWSDDDCSGFRAFSPSYFVDILADLGVEAVVRLNEPQYAADGFASQGVEVHDLEFEDCTSPPKDVVRRFFRIVDSTPGVIAVHCKAGLGRTGTLIGLYLMLSCGFEAREAMGWLRIMRPGSVIGPQQQYLCDVGQSLLARSRCTASSPGTQVNQSASATTCTASPARAESVAAAPTAAAGVATFGGGSGVSGSKLLAAQVSAGARRRAALAAGAISGAGDQGAGGGGSSASLVPRLSVISMGLNAPCV
jgi:cell division cycle 14